MKKVFAILLAMVMVFSLAACSSGGGSEPAEEPANRLEAIKARGYIEMATEPYFAPYEFIDSSKSGASFLWNSPPFWPASRKASTTSPRRRWRIPRAARKT